ncbi:unnamed protein product [Arctogadus glacialis]
MWRFLPWRSRGDLPDASDSLSEASGHSSRKHQPNDLLNEAIPPGNVQVTHVSSSTVSLTWETPAVEVGSFVVTCFCDSETHGEQTTDSDTVTFSDLKPGLKYDFHIKTQLKSGGLSQPALTSAHTETELEGFLKKLGLKEKHKDKLSLSNVLQIDKKAVTEEAAKCLSDLPWRFLKRLMMVNATARNVTFSAGIGSEQDHPRGNADLDIYTMWGHEESELVNVAREREIWGPLLELLPPRPDPG